MQKYLVLAVALFLWCCGPPRPASIFESPSGDAGPTGQIVGTVGVFLRGDDESPNFLNRLLFRSIDGTTTGEIAFTNSSLVSQEVQYSTASEEGSVFLLELAEGNYEFYDVRFQDGERGYRTLYWAKEEFSVPFVVEADQVVYLGSFVAAGARGIPFTPQPWGAGGYFTVFDQFERDKQLVSSLHPDIPADSIQPRLPQITAPPFVVR